MGASQGHHPLRAAHQAGVDVVTQIFARGDECRWNGAAGEIMLLVPRRQGGGVAHRGEGAVAKFVDDLRARIDGPRITVHGQKVCWCTKNQRVELLKEMAGLKIFPGKITLSFGKHGLLAFGLGCGPHLLGDTGDGNEVAQNLENLRSLTLPGHKVVGDMTHGDVTRHAVGGEIGGTETRGTFRGGHCRQHVKSRGTQTVAG